MTAAVAPLKEIGHSVLLVSPIASAAKNAGDASLKALAEEKLADH